MESTIEAEPEVYFVSYSDFSDSSLFESAVKACQAAGIEPKQLTSNECLASTPSTSNDIYILDSFETEVFSYLQEHNVRICGAPCVLHCLEKSEDLPGADHPVFSMCLSGSLITLTGVPTTDRVDIVKKIEWLGGTFTKNLVKSTSHLIAQETSSKKYHAAIGLKIPVLTLDWLTDSYEKSQTSLFDAKDADFMRKYKCPTFLGCVVTASNISERDKIKHIVEKGGGKYCGQMAYRECTHLVIDRPEGQKFKMAQKWGSISIVSPLWVYDCDTAGHRVSEELSKYSIRKVSTPCKEEYHAPNPPDVSVIHSNTFSVTHIDETMSTTTFKSAQTSTVGRNRSAGSDKTINASELTCNVLDKLKVCIRGFDDKTTASLTAIVTSCGGSRSQSTVNADYIVICTLDEDTKQHINSLRQPVVSVEWLKAVQSTQALVDVESYLLYKPAKRRRSSVGQETAPASKSSRLSEETISPFADQSMLDTELIEGNNDNLLLSQYTVGREANAEKTITDRKSVSAEQTAGAGVAQWVEKIGTDTPVIKRPKPKSPFEGLRFTIYPKVSSKERAAVSVMIRSHGGAIVEDSRDDCFNVMPLVIDHRHVMSSNGTAVSTVWVRACDRSCCLLPVESNALFTPVSCDKCDMLSGCVVTTTGLSAYEREAISDLMATSGGRYFEDLRKLPGSSIPATTHLICESTESAKYKAAKNWGIDITNIRWLTDSVSVGSSQPIENYHPLADKDKKEVTEKRTLASLQTPVHSRVQALRAGLTNTTQKKRSGKQYLSTSILDDPEKSFHAKLDLACFDTPGKPSVPSNKAGDTPLDQALSKYLQLAVDKHYVKTPEAAEAISTEATSSRVLAGAVICLSKKLSAQSAYISALVKSLGGQFSSCYDSSVTHLVFQGKATEGEYRAAKRANQYIVCPLWLEKCKAEKQKVAEALYPHNYKTDRALRGIENSTPGSRRSQRLSVPALDLEESPPNPHSPNRTSPQTAQAEAEPETQTTLAETMLVYKQIKAYMKKRVTIPKHTKKSEATNTTTSSPSSNTETTRQPKDIYVDSQSQEDMLVTWDDATSRCEQQKANDDSELDSEVMGQMEDDFTQEQEVKQPASQDLSANYTVDNQVQMETSLLEDASSARKIFQFSGFSNEIRDEMSEKLRSLGGETIISSNFDVDCTHIILNKPQRNEKYLCALVKGLWLLNESYVQACIDAGKLISEGSHEWGNPECSHPISSAAKPFAEASHRRRISVQGGHGSAPFSSWKVILALSKEKTDSMRRILELGGATVLSDSGLPSPSSAATHAFIDVKKSDLTKEDIEGLLLQEVKCLRAEYIPACLMTPAPLDDIKFSIGQRATRSAGSDNSTRRTTRQQSVS